MFCCRGNLFRFAVCNDWKNLPRSFCSKDDSIQKAREELSAKGNEPAITKTYKMLKEEVQRYKQGIYKYPEPKVPKHVDFVVLGGGIIGSSIAYFMKQRAPESFDLMVVEKDPKYTRSSSVLSCGGIRQQFSLPENIKLSLYSSEFLRNVKRHLSVLDEDPPDIQFQPHGYLFLANEAGAEQLMENHKLQSSLGAKVELLRPKQLSEKFPWLNIEGVALGSHGRENEGWFDPWALLSAFKKKASSLGAKFVNGEVIGFEFEPLETSAMDDSAMSRSAVHHLYIKDESGEVHCVEFSVLIVAAGPFSGEVAKMLNIGNGPGYLQVPVPVEPRKRYIYTFHCDNGPGIDMPFVIDSTGTYVRREGLGGLYICGRSPKSEEEEPDISNLDVDYNYFENSVWPSLSYRVPAFEAIKIRGAWAGYYDYNTFDQNALFGYHPAYENIVFATGFSGHGIQMAPGIAQAMTELLLDKDYNTFDMTRLELRRLFADKPLMEKNII